MNMVFSDGATFRLSALVNQSGVRMWKVKTHISHLEMKMTTQSPCSDIEMHSFRPFHFSESIVAGIAYVDLQQDYLMSHLQKDIPRVI
jgi:hypothetical protein